MPVLIERPKMTRTMYMALKRHILQEGERKKKEQRMEADAEAERMRKQREEANLRLRQQQQQQEQEDNLTIEQLAQVVGGCRRCRARLSRAGTSGVGGV